MMPGRRDIGMPKLLPNVPDMDTQLSLSAKMIDRRTSTPKGSHSYGSYFLEYSLMAEYNLLRKQKLPGIYVIPSAKTPLRWFGVLFIRQGLYQEGVFRFQVHIPDNYPDGDCPKVVFDSQVFHPAVDPSSHELNVRQGFHKWRRNINHIWQLLLYTRRIFYKIDTTNALNVEAAALYESDMDVFKSRTQDCVMDWKERLFTMTSDDPHYMKFSVFEEEIHGPVRQAMKTRKEGEDALEEEEGIRDRKSYVASGSLQIYSEPISMGSNDRPNSLPK